MQMLRRKTQQELSIEFDFSRRKGFIGVRYTESACHVNIILTCWWYYTWHADGHDKLSPYGFCIHGCIDG